VNEKLYKQRNIAFNMVKKKFDKKNNKNHHSEKSNHHPIFREKLTFGQRSADRLANVGGSWWFILAFFIFIVVWMGINSWILFKKPFDPYPYILLNLTLSCLAAIQAPIILMTQNRQTERDRIDAKYDHQINRKAEREIQKIQVDLDKITRHVLEIKRNKK
jgi:uncharacterized membrane protein